MVTVKASSHEAGRKWIKNRVAREIPVRADIPMIALIRIGTLFITVRASRFYQTLVYVGGNGRRLKHPHHRCNHASDPGPN